jgi:hypothetical protein
MQKNRNYLTDITTHLPTTAVNLQPSNAEHRSSPLQPPPQLAPLLLILTLVMFVGGRTTSLHAPAVTELVTFARLP